MSSYQRTTPDAIGDAGYAQSLTPEAAAWLAERADPKFKPKKNRKPTLKPRPLSDAKRAEIYAQFNVKVSEA